MTQLRRPSASVSKLTGSQRPSMPKPNALLGDTVCDGCRWPDRCVYDAICWRLEKLDIAAERLA